VKSFTFNSVKIVLARRSYFRGETRNALTLARGVPAIISTRSSSLPTFSLVIWPSTVNECFTPSGS
jgi:hypothetical protein